MEMHEMSEGNNNIDAAIVVKNGYKRYNKANVVLKGLNMTVPEGTIYGLLGPSGCGKTTLLHCILGTIELDSGEIKVKAKTKSNIGYMPQEISLYEDLSIIETMVYYGRIFNLSNDEINKRTDELLSFLELSSKFNVISELSGGQSRRVSFAVALLHDPQLLILDEPTVGVDPILSVSMWDRLLFMVENQNKTVIITTHYIEETRRAHVIGLMRNGEILTEDSPSQLMTRYNSSNLEDVFLQLCQRGDTTTSDQTNENQDIPSYPTPTPKKNLEVPVRQNTRCSSKILLALMTKHFYWMKKNKLIMLYIILEPVLNCMLYSTCIGNDPVGLKLAVVNEEYPQISRCDWFHKECNFSLPLSCLFLNKLQEKIYDLIQYHDIETAKNAVKRNQVWGMLHFSKNYTAAMNERIMITLRDQEDDADLTPSEVKIWLDMSNQYIGYLMKRDIRNACIEYIQDFSFHCGWLPKKDALIPIRIEEAIFGSNTPILRHTLIPELLSLYNFYFPMIFTTGAYLMEKATGSLNRSFISGVTVLEIAISHVIVQFIVLILQNTSMILGLFVILDNPIIFGNLIWIVPVLFSTGASGTFYGLLVAVICDLENTAVVLHMGTALVLTDLCGLMWPVQGQSRILRSFSENLPLTRSADAFRALSIKNWPITHSTVYNAFLTNIVWSVTVILITSIVIKKTK